MPCTRALFVLLYLGGIIVALAGSAPAEEPAAKAPRSEGIAWFDNYAEAMSEAERQDKMMLIYFRDASSARFESESLDNERVQRRLGDFVCVRLPLSAKIKVRGKKVVILEHPAFAEMLGKPGIAIVDFRSTDAKLRGSVVSTFPLTERLWYTPARMAVILDLPPGTLTQRTLIFAVRIHPDKPASTDGDLNTDLVEEAEHHAEYQADVRHQGHQFWDSRFRRLLARLPGGLAPREVCAESWAGEHLVEAAIECVRCWRLSDGHWSAVRARQKCFGYDMKRGSNGIWYATGVLGGR